MSRRLLVVSGVAVAVLLVAWTFLLWKPKGNDLAAAKVRTESAEVRSTDLQVRLQRLQAASARRPALEASQQRLRAAVPEGPELAQFLLDANTVANDAGVDFLSVSPVRPADSTGGLPPAMAIDVAVEGSYFAVLDYLNRMLTLPRIVVIDDITVKPQGEGRSPRLAVNFNGRLFSQTTGRPEATPAPAAASTPAPVSATPAVAR